MFVKHEKVLYLIDFEFKAGKFSRQVSFILIPENTNDFLIKIFQRKIEREVEMIKIDILGFYSMCN